MIELPNSLAGYFYYISSVPYWKAKFNELWRHSRGHITTEEKQFYRAKNIEPLYSKHD